MPFLNKSKAYRPSREDRSRSHAFDEKSGLAYTEVVVRAAPMRADWVWKTRGSIAEIAMFRSTETGSSTLLNMTIRKACLNVVNMTPESLIGLDWHAGKLLWERIVALYVQSLLYDLWAELHVVKSTVSMHGGCLQLRILMR